MVYINNIMNQYSIVELIDVCFCYTLLWIGESRGLNSSLYASTNNQHDVHHHPHTYLIDMLLIDTEGHDALVLMGTYSLLGTE